MGAQQANARKLEQDFKGVFIHSDRNQVTVYGPPKEVTKCFKHIETLLPEDSPSQQAAATTASPVMTIDKDRARALIGAGGSNIQRIETDTNTSIKVNILKKDDEDSPATVKVTGDKANADKAR